jgi:hypothetical protein
MRADGRWVSNFLVDGMLRGTWWIDRDGKRSATLAVRPFGELPPAEREEVVAEAKRMVEFSEPEAAVRGVRFEPPLP